MKQKTKQQKKKSRHLFKMSWCCHNYTPKKKIYKNYRISNDGFCQIMTEQFTIFECTKCGKTKKKLTKVFPKF